MNDKQWYDEQIDQLQRQLKSFEARALLTYLRGYLRELDARIAQNEGRIDGELWNHEEW